MWTKTKVGNDIHYTNDGADTGVPLVIVVADNPSDPQYRVTYAIPYIQSTDHTPTTAEIESYFDDLYGVT